MDFLDYDNWKLRSDMDDNQEKTPTNQPSSFEQLSEEDREAINAMDSMHQESGYDQYSTYASWMEGWTPEYYYRVTIKGHESYGHEICFEFLTDQAAIKFAMGLLSGGARCRKAHRGSPNSKEISDFSVGLQRIRKSDAEKAEKLEEEAHARYKAQREAELERVKEKEVS